MVQSVLEKTNIETEAWELFEVGSYQDLIDLAEQNPKSLILHDLSILSKFENNSVTENLVPSQSIFTPLVRAYVHSYLNNWKESSEKLIEYFKQKNRPICYTILSFGVKTTFRARMFSECLAIIGLEKNPNNQISFLTEKIESYFGLKKYEELTSCFRTNFKFINQNYELYLKASLAFHALGKYKEAEALIRNVPNKKILPSFEEMKSRLTPVINNIPILEKKVQSMNSLDLKELGFAYLFNQDYEKAEATFRRAISLVK